MPDSFEIIFASRDCFLVLLLAGWRFPGDVAEPMRGGHGEYTVILWRPAEQNVPQPGR